MCMGVQAQWYPIWWFLNDEQYLLDVPINTCSSHSGTMSCSTEESTAEETLAFILEVHVILGYSGPFSVL